MQFYTLADREFWDLQLFHTYCSQTALLNWSTLLFYLFNERRKSTKS